MLARQSTDRTSARQRSYWSAASAHERAEVDLPLRAGADPDDHDPAARCQRAHVGRQVRRADQLENDVEGAVALESLGLDGLGAELADRGTQLLVPDGRRHRGAGRTSELDGRGSDSTGPTVDQ